MRRLLIAIAVALTTLVVVGTAGQASAAGPPNCSSEAASRSAWVDCVLSGMTVEERVGQMFVVNGYGARVNAHGPGTAGPNHVLYGPTISNLEDLIQTYHVGGVIYFAWTNNLKNPIQTAKLSNGIQRVALRQPSQAPMLISTDQEQGEVLRIGPPGTVFPGNMALGATRSLDLTRSNASITGQELRAQGINVDDAPVIDSNTNPLNAADGIRAFSDRVSFVSQYGAAQVLAYQGPGRVAAVAKHFPGLGDTSTNPDSGISISHQTLSEVERVNLPPFAAAIRAGVDQIMSTHIVMPRVLPSRIPTSLAKPIVTGLLRKRLGYNGVAITDALNAQALSKYTPAQKALLAVRAGEDELLESAGGPSGPAVSDLPKAYDAVLNAVQTNKIPLSRINQSDRRILGLKWKLGLASNPFNPAAAVPGIVGTPTHLDIARETAQRSITVVKNTRGVLPLQAGPGTRVLSTGSFSTTTGLIANVMASRGLTAQPLVTGSNPSATKISQATAAARRNDLVVVNTFNVWSQGSGGQKRLVRALVSTGKPVVVVAIGTPYDIAYFPSVSTFVAAYDFQPVSINAAVAALFGDFSPSGKLPVTIRKPAPSSSVLYPFGHGLSY